jgi:Ca2+-binding RTX toxin-like protein
MSVEQTFFVKAQNGKYLIDGDVAPNLELISGKTYEFNLSDPSLSSHPLGFKLNGNSWDDGVQYSGTLGINQTVTLTVPSISDGTVSYYCSNHSGMGNDLSITWNYITGTVGDDELYGGDGDDDLSAGAGDDTLDGGAGDDRLYGGDGNDDLSSGAGDDEVYGEAGDDIIRLSGSGAQLFDGGSGNDTYIIDLGDWDPGYVMEINLANERHGIYQEIHEGSDTVRNIENVTITSVVDHVIVGDENDNILISDTGNDTITGGDGDDTLTGGDGDDTLTGGEGSDTINGGAGLDSIILTETTSVTDTIEISSVVGTSEESGRTVVAGNDNDTGEDLVTGFAIGTDVIKISATEVVGFVHGTDTAIGTATGGVNDGTVGSFLTTVGLVELNQITNNNWDDAGDVTVTFTTTIGTFNESNFEAALQYDITGTAAANMITGGVLADTISGGAGDDTLIGGDGNDTLDGGDGDDTIIGGGRESSIEGTPLRFVQDWTDSLIGGEGDDVLDASQGSNAAWGSFIRPGPGHDNIIGSRSVWDNFDGLDLAYFAVSEGITVNIGEQGSGTVTSESGLINDSFSFANYFIGTGSGDTFNGSDTSEDPLRIEGFITGNAYEGVDRVYGNGGYDRLAFDTPSFIGISASFSDGTVKNAPNVDVNDQNTNVIFADIDEIRGSAGDDIISAANFSDDTWIFGNGGDDYLIGGNSDSYIQGGAGDDIIESGFGDDVLIGEEGADTYLYEKGDGADTIIGYREDTGDDLWWKGYTDSEKTNLQSQYIDGGWSNGQVVQTMSDGGTVHFYTYASTIIGNRNADLIEGTSAPDHILGNGGNDEIWGNLGDDILDGGDGDDTLKGGAGNDTLTGGDGDDTITGGAGDDTIIGGSGSDVLISGAGNDIIKADGNDLVVMDGGDDEIHAFTSGVELYFDHANEPARYSIGGDIVTVNMQNRTIDDGLGGTDSLVGVTGAFDLHFTDHTLVNVMGDVGDNYVYLGGRAGVTDAFIDGGAGYDVVNFGSEFYQYSDLKTITSVSSKETNSLTFVISGVHPFSREIQTTTTTIKNIEEIHISLRDEQEIYSFETVLFEDIPDYFGIIPGGPLPFSIVSEKSGDNVTVSFYLDPDQDPADAGVGSFNATVGFEPNSLTYVSSSFADGLTGVPNTTELDSGTLGLGGFGLTPVTDLATALFSVTFDANGTSEPVQLTLSEVEVDATSLSGGTYTFDLTGATLLGSIVTRSGTALPEVVLATDTGLSAQTSFSGAFEMDLSGSEQLLSGSLSFSNTGFTKAISAADALDALKLSVGLSTDAGVGDAFSLISADFDQNGRVTAADALEILKYSVGLTAQQDAKWVFVDTAGDYSDISKSNTSYTDGMSIADLSADTSVSLTGILIGDVNDSYSGLIA